MKIAFFSAKPYDCEFYKKEQNEELEFEFFADSLDEKTAARAINCTGVCLFVNDIANDEALKVLSSNGVKFILLRSAGYDNVDMDVAKELGLKVFSVPSYSPNAVAEFAVGLLLSLNRKIHKAFTRTRDQNFDIDGLMGFDLQGKTIGIIGTGKIGAIFAKIMHGFDCKLLGYDVVQNKNLVDKYGLSYVSLNELLSQSDIISLHAPLTPDTRYIINSRALEHVKKGVLIINTSRGGLVDTAVIIQGIKAGLVGGYAMDVYEAETGLFHNDLSHMVLKDDKLSRLLSFSNNVIVSSHQGFFTKEAFENIVKMTMSNFNDFKNGKFENELTEKLSREKNRR